MNIVTKIKKSFFQSSFSISLERFECFITFYDCYKSSSFSFIVEYTNHTILIVYEIMDLVTFS